MDQFNEPELCLQGGVGIERQIEAQIRDYIARGDLLPGEQLPTVRAVAVGLAVNPGAVRSAYSALETQGFLTSEEGSGTFIASMPRRAGTNPGGREMLEQICAHCLTQACCLGFSAQDVMATIQRLLGGGIHHEKAH